MVVLWSLRVLVCMGPRGKVSLFCYCQGADFETASDARIRRAEGIVPGHLYSRRRILKLEIPCTTLFFSFLIVHVLKKVFRWPIMFSLVIE